MSFLAVMVLALGLSMDATAVAAARGLALDRVRVRDVLEVALCFGGFQAAMPLAGWALGSALGSYAAAFDHWIAFGLLAAIGGKMLYEALTGEEEAAAEARGDWKTLLALGVATSIDAFAAGVTLPMMGARLGPAVLAIGLTTAILSGLGLWAGRRFGAIFGPKLEIAGGVLLIALGGKILIEHLSA